MSWLAKMRRKFIEQKKYRLDYFGDGFGVRNRNLGFMEEPEFSRVYAAIAERDSPHFGGQLPDVRWRMQICLWAATHGLSLDGDFVEFGVNTGLFSSAICQLTAFASSGKTFYLFDTFNGIPEGSIDDNERDKARRFNAEAYTSDVYDVAKRNFASYPTVQLVRGVLPGSLDDVALGKIAYVSIDLNIARPEIETIRRIWDLIVPGALIVLDDFAFKGHEAQYNSWTSFAHEKGTVVCTLPTGQGLIAKPGR